MLRIHRAIGWGMPWTEFQALQTLEKPAPTSCDLNEGIYDRFNDAGPETLTVPETVMVAVNKSRDIPVILDRRLLATKFTLKGSTPPEFGPGHDLYTIVSNPDDTLAIVFFPTLSIRRKWYSVDSDLDFTFEQWRNGTAERAEPRQILVYPRTGFHLWDRHYRLADGTPVRVENPHDVATHPEWLPAVPSEIRWYLTALDILDEDGVNALRPTMAQWWT